MIPPLKFHLKLNETSHQHQSNIATCHIINFKKIGVAWPSQGAQEGCQNQPQWHTFQSHPRFAKYHNMLEDLEEKLSYGASSLFYSTTSSLLHFSTFGHAIMDYIRLELRFSLGLYISASFGIWQALYKF